MKQIIFLLCGILAIAIGCKKDNRKETQTIDFGKIAPQILKNGLLQLKAETSSGLPVIFKSGNSDIAVISNDTVVFQKSGTVNITAKQAGNDQYYEAPNVVQSLTIIDWDSNKQYQTISFELPESWNNEGPLQLEATATSGLSVTFTSDNSKGEINANNELILYHGTETYDVYINVTASQTGNSKYNPAENVVRTIHALGTGTH